MPRVDLLVESKISQSPRVRQLEGLFDVPPAKTERIAWKGSVPLEAKPWQVGLIVGPSGSGKSTLLRGMFGETRALEWRGAAVIEDFDAGRSLQEIADVCSAVGFNTIPAWRRPFSVLSNGERFRVELARRLLESDGLVLMDEFTSVVDRQVAKIGAHAVQRYVRKDAERRFVAASCHYDVLEWLRPDWILEPHEMRFEWTTGRLVRRPELNVTIGRVSRAAWSRFAPYHYMTAELHKAATCFGLWVEKELVSFLGLLHLPHPKRKDIKRGSRVVTLPDWQGLGLSFVLFETVAAAYKAVGMEFRGYPAHPEFVRSFRNSKRWRCVKAAGTFSSRVSKGSRLQAMSKCRPNAVFAYCGPALPNREHARALLVGDGPQSELSSNWAGLDRADVAQKPSVSVEDVGARRSSVRVRRGDAVGKLSDGKRAPRKGAVGLRGGAKQKRAAIVRRPRA